MEKKKSPSLLNMLLRNGTLYGKGKKDSVVPHPTSSTPLDQSVDVHSRDVMHASESQSRIEGGSTLPKRVQFDITHPSTSRDQLANTNHTQGPTFTWDSYGLPEARFPSSSDQPPNPPSAQSTPPTRIVTPDIDYIERMTTRLDVELSVLEYNVSNPFDYIKKVKDLSDDLDLYCVRVEPNPSRRVFDLRSVIANLLHKLQGAKPRSNLPRKSSSGSEGILHANMITHDVLESRFTQFHSDMEAAFSSQLEKFKSTLDQSISAIEARIATNVHNSILNEFEDINRQTFGYLNQVFESINLLSAKIQNLDQLLSTNTAACSSVSSRVNQLNIQLVSRVQQLENRLSSLQHDCMCQATGRPNVMHNHATVQSSAQQETHRLPRPSTQLPAGMSHPSGSHSCPVEGAGNAATTFRRGNAPIPTPRSSLNRSFSTLASIPLNDSPYWSSSASASTPPPDSDYINYQNRHEPDPEPQPRVHTQTNRDFHTSQASINSTRVSRLINRINECAHSINHITSKDLFNLNRAEVMELCKYDLVSVQNLRKEMVELDKKIDDLQVDDEVYDCVDSSLAACKKFENDLNELRKSHYLHLESDRSLLKKLELDVFDGSPDKDTVYNFLSMFFRLTDGIYSPSDQAAILYTTYLSEPIRRECESFKHDIHAMRDWLIFQHGDLREVVNSKLKGIAKLKHPGPSEASQVDYYKHIMQLLLHVESLSTNDLVNAGEIRSIIHNVTLVKSIVSFLPDSIVNRFSKLIQREPQVPPPSGERYFSILKKMIDGLWRELHTAHGIKSIREPSASLDIAHKKSVNVTDSNSHAPTPKPRHQNKQDFAHSNSTFAFPCTLHNGKGKAHEFGNCRTFFSGSNQDRVTMAKKLLHCFTCFKPDCLKRSPQVCISNVPAGLICSDCAQTPSRRTPNVLLCTNESHKKPKMSALETDLLLYFKVLDKRLLHNLKPIFNIVTPSCMSITSASASNTKPVSRSSPVVPTQPIPKFDTQHGTPLANSSIVYDNKEDSIYIFQHIRVNKTAGLLFYDSGATGHCVRGKFAEEAGFKVVNSETQQVGSFGDQTLWTDYGTYSCVLGSNDSQGYELYFQGISNITGRFPSYSWSTVNEEVRSSGLLSGDDRLPTKVGGSEVDILIGVRSPDLIPKLLFTLPSGLAVFRCQLADINGSTIAYGGSHACISHVNKHFSNLSVNQLTIMFSRMASEFSNLPWIDSSYLPIRQCLPKALTLSEFQTNLHAATPCLQNDLPLDQTVDEPIARPSKISCVVCKAAFPLDKMFKVIDPEDDHLVTFRCTACEDCTTCKSSPALQSMSIKERAEQSLIKDSIRVSLEEKKTYVKLPFLEEPTKFFKKHFRGQSSNYDQAERFFRQVCKTSEENKQGIRKAVNEFLENDFIGELDSAPPEIQDLVNKAPISQFYLWQAVYKDSKTTPVRLVVDPSRSHLNLNLAKGSAGLANMHSILLRARSAEHLWTSDVRKLYNCLHLEKEAIPFSLFLYHPDLDPSTKPKIFYMKRAWYGVRSTGSQASEAFKILANLFKDTHPLGAKVLLSSTYVDDILSGTKSVLLSEQEVREVTEILEAGGFSLKFVAHSFEEPPSESSSNGESLNILGYKWTPLCDTIALNLKEVNFQKKKRGLKPDNPEPVNTPDAVKNLVTSLPALTRRHVVGKCSEIYDPLGLYEPVKAALKRSLVSLNHLDWNERLSEYDQQVWINHLMLWPDLAKISFPRSVIPTNAEYPLRSRIICMADASADCGGVCLYLSFKLKDGSWSAQILAAKSRLLKFSVPRNELEMIELACELVFATVVSLEFPFEEIIIATDSLIALCWSVNDKIRHKVYVMNRVLAINRFLRWTRERVGPKCSVELVHIPSECNIADCLTKGTATTSLISQNSLWQLGYPWMKGESSNMPFTRFSDISLNSDDVKHYMEEVISGDPNLYLDPVNSNMFSYPVRNEIFETTVHILKPPVCPPSSFLSLSSGKKVQKHKPQVPEYLIDVVHTGWHKSCRILGHCIEFLVILMHRVHTKCQNPSVQRSLLSKCPLCTLLLSSNSLDDSLNYFQFNGDDHNIDLLPPGLTPIISEGLNPSNERFVCTDDIFLNSIHVGCEARPVSTPSPGVDISTQLNSVSPIINFNSPLSQQCLTKCIDIILQSYWNVIATKECLAQLPKSELKHFQIDEQSRLLFYKGRVGKDQSISVYDLDLLKLKFLDSTEITFHSPCLMPTSDIFYAFAIHCHFNASNHSGLESTLHHIEKRFHVIRPRKTLNSILKDCVKCKLVKRQVLSHEMANHNAVRFTYAPPFTYLQCDLAQHFHAKSRNSGRQTCKAPAFVACCLVTGAIAIHIMEDWSTESVVSALTRLGTRYGMPAVIYIDSGSQLKALKHVSFDIQTLSHNLKCKMSCQLVIAPPKSHVGQGRVERRIGIVRDMLLKLGEPKFLMSFLSWETLFSSISNHLNDLPIARASERSIIRPEFSILTANRLLVGRNNNRALAGPMHIDFRLSSIHRRAIEAQETFFQLLHKHLYSLVPKSKWFSSDHIDLNDIVIFFFEDSLINHRSRPWHFGRVIAIDGSRLTIEYTVGMSDVKKAIERSKRDCCRISSEDELIFNSRSHMENINKSQ